MPWQLRIREPSGESRVVSIQGLTTLGSSKTSNIILRDPTAAKDAATIWPTSSQDRSPFWIKMNDLSSTCQLGDLSVREAQLPLDIGFQIGETKLRLEAPSSSKTGMPFPEFPPGVRPWYTRTEVGRQILWTAKKTATTPLSIYLAGETGTGKEVISQLIHAWSDRKSGPFVAINCGALSLSLAESELFGHLKGSFTGADHHRPGALMQAHGGTLFLDEIGDLPMDIQVKLLRFLENGEIRSVGADRNSRADVRLICATHHPLPKLINEGKFRRDLYYRIASVTLAIPSLRSRPQDIELLAKKFAEDLQRSITPRALLRLKAHPWPGNVRELRHTIERASGLAGPFVDYLSEDHFEFLMTSETIEDSQELDLGAPVLSLHEMERVILLKALRLTYGNRARAAKLLGVARSTLFEMLKRHNVMGPRSKNL